MQLDPDFREFIECCIASEVEFLIDGVDFADCSSRRTEIDVEALGDDKL